MKINKKYLLPLVVLGSITLGSCGKKYEIDGNQVQFDDNAVGFNNWAIKETKSEGKTITYYFEGFYSDNPLENFVIRGESYGQKDSLIYQSAQKRIEYLKHKRDSLDEVARQEKIKYILNALE